MRIDSSDGDLHFPNGVIFMPTTTLPALLSELSAQNIEPEVLARPGGMSLHRVPMGMEERFYVFAYLSFFRDAPTSALIEFASSASIPRPVVLAEIAAEKAMADEIVLRDCGPPHQIETSEWYKEWPPLTQDLLYRFDWGDVSSYYTDDRGPRLGIQVNYAEAFAAYRRFLGVESRVRNVR